VAKQLMAAGGWQLPVLPAAGAASAALAAAAGAGAACCWSAKGPAQHCCAFCASRSFASRCASLQWAAAHSTLSSPPHLGWLRAVLFGWLADRPTRRARIAPAQLTRADSSPTPPSPLLRSYHTFARLPAVDVCSLTMHPPPYVCMRVVVWYCGS
jgi:hypothetical protein